MKYSVGDVFLDRSNSIIQIIGVVVDPESYFGGFHNQAHYVVSIDGKKSFMRWYDRELDAWENITSPVLKELYNQD
jgi:hypothetical protein